MSTVFKSAHYYTLSLPFSLFPCFFSFVCPFYDTPHVCTKSDNHTAVNLISFFSSFKCCTEDFVSRCQTDFTQLWTQEAY